MENEIEKRLRRKEERKKEAEARFGKIEASDTEYWKNRKQGLRGQGVLPKSKTEYSTKRNRSMRRKFKELWRAVVEGKPSIRFYTTKHKTREQIKKDRKKGRR